MIDVDYNDIGERKKLKFVHIYIMVYIYILVENNFDEAKMDILYIVIIFT
jgi:hypothetical protein